LVVATHLEACRAPANELDRPLGLDRRDGSTNVHRDNIAAIQNRAGDVLALMRVTLNHHVGWCEEGIGDLGDGQLFVIGLLGADDRRI
jgi:hypothetical protein